MSLPLTQHLLYLPITGQATFKAATQHEFLVSAGAGTLGHDRLAFWLSQDYIFVARTGPKLLGSIISQIPFGSSEYDQSLCQRILELLVSSLQNVIREVKFFEDSASKWDLKLAGWEERKATTEYIVKISHVSAGKDFEQSLVFLWALEKIYLDSWSFVKRQLSNSAEISAARSGVTEQAIHAFVNNWTCEEFQSFVDALTELLNKLFLSADAQAWREAEATWQRALELEEQFWPRAKFM